MQTLRNARWITRLVLVWFALFVTASVASPFIKPADTQMVCSASGGMKWVSLNPTGSSDNGDPTEHSTSSMDCPLCATVAFAPSFAVLAVHVLSERAHTPIAYIARHSTWSSGSPLPPRGPPTSLLTL